jgi:hypothetical protein
MDSTSQGNGNTSAEVNDIKFKIVETNKELRPKTEFKSLCWNEKINLQLIRNNTIVKGTWKLGATSISDTSTFTLDMSKEIKDTLKVFDNNSYLLASISINIYDKPFIFKIVELNKSIQPNTELPIMRKKGKYNIQLYKGDSLVICNWSYGTLKVNDTTTFPIDLFNVKKDSIKVYDNSSRQLAAFILNIYNKPEINFEIPEDYDGSFGFDNYYNRYTVLAKDTNYRSHYVMGEKKWIPWISVYKKQPNIQLQLKINNYAEFLGDSTAYIKINTSNTNIKATVTAIPGNTIKFSNITSITNSFDLEIIVSDYLDNNQYLYITDHYGDTLSMISVLCKKPKSDLKLNVIYISDATTNNNNFSIDTNYFDKKSYNQAFIDWTFYESHIKLAYRDTLSQFDSISTNLKKLINFLYSQLIKSPPRGIGMDITNNKNKCYFLIILPINYITTEDNQMSGGAFKETMISPYWPFAILTRNAIKNTIAVHEIGHTLKLEHIFIDIAGDCYKLGLGEGTTKNYMDYRISTGDDMNYFWKWQWKIINNQIP